MRSALRLAAALGLTLLTLLAGLSLGSSGVTFGEVIRSGLYWLGASGTALPETTTTIIWELRMPRVLLGLLVGSGLSVVGVGMQTLVRNPLAEPYLLGISSGASVGVALTYLGWLPPALGTALSLPAAAWIGGFAALAIVYLVARRGTQLPITRLLLAGVAVSAMLGALSSFITLAAPEPDKIRTVLFLLLGSLSSTRWEMLLIPAVTTLGGLLVLWLLARPLDALLLGEEPARSLGVPMERLKQLLILIAAVVTGSLVAYAGIIGFVGLVVPHVARLIVGVGHRRLLPLSAWLGGLFLVWADIAARVSIPDQEVPVGIVTALCGVPFFLWLLRRSTYRFS